MDVIAVQKHKLDTMRLTDGELEMLARSRRNIGLLGFGGTAVGGLGGYFMTKGNGASRFLIAFGVGSTAIAGGCLGLALGIQSALEFIAKQPGDLASELRTYQYKMAIYDHTYDDQGDDWESKEGWWTAFP